MSCNFKKRRGCVFCFLLYISHSSLSLTLNFVVQILFSHCHSFLCVRVWVLSFASLHNCRQQKSIFFFFNFLKSIFFKKRKKRKVGSTLESWRILTATTLEREVEETKQMATPSRIRTALNNERFLPEDEEDLMAKFNNSK